MSLEIGDEFPGFQLPTNNGGTISRDDLLGQWCVLYFYPKDNTPGCTTEAIDFTASKADFDALNCQIIGVSKDSVKKHDNFVAKHSLGITLASDADGDLTERSGVWVEKSMYGKTFFGIERATFLINRKGQITDIWRKVRVKGHVDAVLNQLRQHVEASD